MPQMHCNFFSYSLGHGVDLTITLPGVSPCDMDDPALLTHQMPEKFPVLYLLHGHGNDYLSWERFTCVSRYAEEYRIAVVSVSVGNTLYMDTKHIESAGVAALPSSGIRTSRAQRLTGSRCGAINDHTSADGGKVVHPLGVGHLHVDAAVRAWDTLLHIDGVLAPHVCRNTVQSLAAVIVGNPRRAWLVVAFANHGLRFVLEIHVERAGIGQHGTIGGGLARSDVELLDHRGALICSGSLVRQINMNPLIATCFSIKR